MIRILQLCSTSDLGGAERMVLNLASALPRDEFETHIGALIGSGALMERAAKLHLPNIHFKFSNAVDPAGVFRLIAYCRRHQIDIIQSHGLRAEAVARWAARLGGIKCAISTIHSIDPWRRTPHVMLDRLTAPFVNQYIAVCDAARDAAMEREKVPGKKIITVPIGVPGQQIPRDRREAIRQGFGLTDENYPAVGVLANLREMKGHLYILEAIPAILDKNPKAVFLFAGRDDSNGAIKAAAEKAGVDHAVHFLGFVDNTPELFAAMDIFLTASDWEGFPVSVLEAMQAGVPVIATRVGGIPEMIRDGQDGLLIEPRNPPAISSAINLLTHDFALRASIVKSADARFQANYTLEAMAGKMGHIYHELLENA